MKTLTGTVTVLSLGALGLSVSGCGSFPLGICEDRCSSAFRAAEKTCRGLFPLTEDPERYGTCMFDVYEDFKDCTADCVPVKTCEDLCDREHRGRKETCRDMYLRKDPAAYDDCLGVADQRKCECVDDCDDSNVK